MTAAQLYTLAPMVKGDARDALLFSMYARARWSRRGWLMILSGLAAFNRSIGG